MGQERILRVGRWICCLIIFLFLAMPLGFLAWKNNSIGSLALSFQPSKMELTQYTQKHVIGDLGGIKVHIPQNCAEHVEYNSDPGFGEQRKGFPPERTLESKLRSFGIDARLPEMECKHNKDMIDDYRHQFLKADSPWISIGVNSGEIYPGIEAANRHAKFVINSIDKPTDFWLDNYERVAGLVFGLDAYVVKGVDPHSGVPARESEKTNDKFFNFDRLGVADTYISCGRTYVSGGVATCSMKFSMEPLAKVLVNVRFVRSRLPQWRNIRQSTFDFLAGFEFREENFDRSPSQGFKVN